VTWWSGRVPGLAVAAAFSIVVVACGQSSGDEPRAPDGAGNGGASGESGASGTGGSSSGASSGGSGAGAAGSGGSSAGASSGAGGSSAGSSGATAGGSAGAAGATAAGGAGEAGAGDGGASSCEPTPPGPRPTTGVIGIATGDNHACALLEGGRVRCWGSSVYGQLGYGNIENVGDDETPASAGDVSLGGAAVQVSAGCQHSCALLDDGTVRCWGFGAHGQLGYGDDDDVGDDELPDAKPALDFGLRVVRVEAGCYHTCALLEDGTVRCWGHNTHAELGAGDDFTSFGESELATTAPPVELGGKVVALATGKYSSCAVLEGGGVRCWGNNAVGTLGYGHVENIGDDELPASAGDVELGGPARAVSVGSGEVCVLMDCGVVRCWGLNRYGGLGLGTADNIGDDELPLAVGPVSVGGKVVQVSCGIEIDQHACVLLEGGAVRCWGWGGTGVLGYGNGDIIGDDELPSSVGPVNVGEGVVELASGGSLTCALLSRGAVRCWGSAWDGQLGYGNTASVGASTDPAGAGDVPVL
jgi:alpha-tubulin suppressor-like RCC1 family protein